MRFYEVDGRFKLLKRYGTKGKALAARVEAMNLPMGQHVEEDCILRADRRTGLTRIYAIPIVRNALAYEFYGTSVVNFKQLDLPTGDEPKLHWKDVVQAVGLPARSYGLSFSVFEDLAGVTPGSLTSTTPYLTKVFSPSTEVLIARLRASLQTDGQAGPYIRYLLGGRTGLSFGEDSICSEVDADGHFWTLHGFWDVPRDSDGNPLEEGDLFYTPNKPMDEEFIGYAIHSRTLELFVQHGRELGVYSPFQDIYLEGDTDPHVYDEDYEGERSLHPDFVPLVVYGHYSRHYNRLRDLGLSLGLGSIFGLIAEPAETEALPETVGVELLRKQLGDFSEPEVGGYITMMRSSAFVPESEAWLRWRPDLVDEFGNPTTVGSERRGVSKAIAIAQYYAKAGADRSSETFLGSPVAFDMDADFTMRLLRLSSSGLVYEELVSLPAGNQTSTYYAVDGYNDVQDHSAFDAPIAFFDGYEFQSVGSTTFSGSYYASNRANPNDNIIIPGTFTRSTDVYHVSVDNGAGTWIGDVGSYVPALSVLLNVDPHYTASSPGPVVYEPWTGSTYSFTNDYVDPDRNSSMLYSLAYGPAWGTYGKGSGSYYSKQFYGFVVPNLTPLNTIPQNYAVPNETRYVPRHSLAWYFSDGEEGICHFRYNHTLTSEGAYKALCLLYRRIVVEQVTEEDDEYRDPDALLAEIMEKTIIHINDIATPALIPWLAERPSRFIII